MARAVSKQQLASRKLQRLMDRQLRKLLRDFHASVMGELLQARIFDEPVGSVTRIETAIYDLLRGRSGELRVGVEMALRDAVGQTAYTVIEREGSMLSALSRNPATKALLKGTVSEELIKSGVVDLIFQGNLGFRINLSQKIWAVSEYAQDVVVRTVTEGLRRGKHAIAVSKDLERVLVPQPTAKSKIWSHGNAPKRLKGVVSAARKGLRTRKNTVAYNYLRIARSEMFRAQRATHLVMVNGLERLFPFKVVQGVRWNLSNSHEVQDICDEWATQDIDNLGSGVYHPQNVPIGHPNDLCFTSSVLINKREFERRWRAAEGRGYDLGALLTSQRAADAFTGAMRDRDLLAYWLPKDIGGKEAA